MNHAVIHRSNGMAELHLLGTRVPAEARVALLDGAALLDQANRLLQQAEQEAESLREVARQDGLAAGRQQATGELAQAMIQIQIEQRRQQAELEPRLVRLATAIVRRILPSLAMDEQVPELALRAVQALQAEQYLSVHVHPDAVAAVQNSVERLAQAQPGVSRVLVAADPGLPPLGCVAESELGSVRAGFEAQLDRIEDALLQAAQAATP